MQRAEGIVKNKYFGNTALAKKSQVHVATYTALEASSVMKINIDDLKTLMPQVYQAMCKGSGGVSTSDISLSEKRAAALEKRKSILAINK